MTGACGNNIKKKVLKTVNVHNCTKDRGKEICQQNWSNYKYNVFMSSSF